MILEEERSIVAKEHIKHKDLAILWNVKIGQVSRILNGHCALNSKQADKVFAQYSYLLTTHKITSPYSNSFPLPQANK